MTDEWTSPLAERIANEVKVRTGMIIVPGRRRLAEASIARAMKRAGITDAETFIALFEREHPSLDDLVAELTVGETYFFRESAQFALLREQIVPRIIEQRGTDYSIRAWSAACASGEEAYSIAIALRESARAGPYVVGTDISRERLAKARHGRYRRWSLRGVPEDVVRRYFTGHGDEWILAPEIRRGVTFRYLNLAEESVPTVATGIWGMDVVFCRNVLIYFDRETIARVAQRLLEALSEDGWLILGAADPPLHDLVACEAVETPAGIAYRRASGKVIAPARIAPVRFPPPAAPPVIGVEPVHVSPPPASAPAFVPPARDPEPATVEHLYERGDYEEVVSRVRSMPAPSAADTIALVRSLANIGQTEEAAAACTTALDADRMSAELQYLQAILLLQASMTEEAAQAARRALYLDPSLVVAHLALGTAHTRLRHFEDARRSLARAESLLSSMPADMRVPASDGEQAGRMLHLARTQRELVERSAA